MASTVVPKLPNEGDHALLLKGQGAATATNSLLIQVYHRCKLQAIDPFILKTMEEESPNKGGYSFGRSW